MDDRKKEIPGKKALMIVNPVSGRKAVQKDLTQIVRILMDAGYLVTTAVTGERGEGARIAAALASDYDLLVCAGGDGTLNECVSGLMRVKSRVPVGYIPCGSTNDIATSRGLPLDAVQAAMRIAAGERTCYDVGLFAERAFIHHALFGAFTWMAYSTDQEQKNVLGYGAYIVDALRDLSKIKPLPLRIEADGSAWDGEFLFGVISTDRHLAGIFELPEEQIGPADGKLAAALIRAPKTVLELEPIVHSILTGIPDPTAVDIIVSESFQVHAYEAFGWSLDGEGSGLRTDVRMSVEQGALELQG
ncbi:MAG: YegS/Rv2252/BmrU family lipid kinase [Oscillospiraceae bacterium]|nr:YegS/Rv2252/BmrU family lipid kinase [Oscillospiraceae bacterium]